MHRIVGRRMHRWTDMRQSEHSNTFTGYAGDEKMGGHSKILHMFEEFHNKCWDKKKKEKEKGILSP